MKPPLAHEANDVDGMPSNIDKKHTESETIVPAAGLPVAPGGDPQEENAEQVDNDNNAASQTAATAHGIEWVRASVSICNSVGDVLAPGGNGVATQNISPLECFC
jgi:hypothetical protein